MELISAFNRVKGARNNRAWFNMAWLFSDRVLRMGLGLAVLIWMARYLGPADFGALNYAIAFVALVWSFSDLGLSNIVVRELVHEPDDMPRTLGTALALRLGATVIAWIVAVYGISLLRLGDAEARTLVVIIATGMVFQVGDTLAWWFEAIVQSKYVVWGRSAAFLVSTLLRVGLILSGASLVAFGYAAAVEAVLAGCGIALVFLWRRDFRIKLRFSLGRAGSLLRDSWPLIFSNLAIVLYMRVDQVMLGNIRGDAAVGIYSTVVMIAEAAYVIPMIVMPSLLPDIVEARRRSEEEFMERLDHLYRLMAFLAYAVAIPLALVSPWLVPFLFGEAYASGGVVLAVLAVAGIFTFMGVARTAFLIPMNWTRTHLATVSVSCVINVGLNLLLIPAHGALGAAFASAVAYWFAVHGVCFLYKPLRPTGMMITQALLYPKFWQ